MAICDPVNLSPGNPPAASVTPSCPDTPHATIGMCLADGTPIAVTTISTCAGTVSSTGWINLINGTWTAGNVPAGTSSCGAARDVELAGGLCDVLNGNVVGYGWVQLVYPQNGGAPAISLINPLNGSPYVPQGVMTPCPAKAVTTAPVCGTVLGGPVETLHAHYGWVGGSNPSQAFFTRPGSTSIISFDEVVVFPCPEIDQAATSIRVVCSDLGGVLTSYFVRDVGTVDNLTGAVTNTDYEYSSDGTTWVLGSVTPIPGTRTAKPCESLTIEVQPICYVTGSTPMGPYPGWALIVHNTDGTSTVTYYREDLVTVFSGTDTPTACVAAAEFDRIGVPTDDWCVENPPGVFTGWKQRISQVISNADGSVVGVDLIEWSNGGAWVTTTPSGTVRAGQCKPVEPAVVEPVPSGTLRRIGNVGNPLDLDGTSWTATALATSFSVLALEGADGDVVVTGPNGVARALYPGSSVEFSIQTDESVWATLPIVVTTGLGRAQITETWR